MISDHIGNHHILAVQIVTSNFFPFSGTQKPDESEMKSNLKISNNSRSPSKRRKILPSKFNNKENYNSGGKFQCPYCKSKFSQKHNLKTHVKKKHHEKPESLHMEKKPFKCSICSKMFQFKDIMQLHKDDHTKFHGVKPFDCKNSGLDFKTE